MLIILTVDVHWQPAKCRVTSVKSWKRGALQLTNQTCNKQRLKIYPSFKGYQDTLFVCAQLSCGNHEYMQIELRYRNRALFFGLNFHCLANILRMPGWFLFYCANVFFCCIFWGFGSSFYLASPFNLRLLASSLQIIPQCLYLYMLFNCLSWWLLSSFSSTPILKGSVCSSLRCFGIKPQQNENNYLKASISARSWLSALFLPLIIVIT